MLENKLGENIKRRRNELGYTMEELARAIGVKESTIHRYETGEIKSLKYQVIVKLANKLNTHPATLMGWTDEEPANSELNADELIVKGFNRLSTEKQKLVMDLIDSMQ